MKLTKKKQQRKGRSGLFEHNAGIQGTQITQTKEEANEQLKSFMQNRTMKIQNNQDSFDQQMGFQYSFNKHVSKPVSQLDETLNQLQKDEVDQSGSAKNGGNNFQSMAQESAAQSSNANPPPIDYDKESPRIASPPQDQTTVQASSKAYIMTEQAQDLKKTLSARRAININANHNVIPSWAGGNYQSNLLLRAQGQNPEAFYKTRKIKRDGPIAALMVRDSTLRASGNTMQSIPSGFKKQEAPQRQKSTIGTLMGTQKQLNQTQLRQKYDNQFVDGGDQKDPRGNMSGTYLKLEGKHGVDSEPVSLKIIPDCRTVQRDNREDFRFSVGGEETQENDSPAKAVRKASDISNQIEVLNLQTQEPENGCVNIETQIKEKEQPDSPTNATPHRDTSSQALTLGLQGNTHQMIQAKLTTFEEVSKTDEVTKSVHKTKDSATGSMGDVTDGNRKSYDDKKQYEPLDTSTDEKAQQLLREMKLMSQMGKDQASDTDSAGIQVQSLFNGSWSKNNKGLQADKGSTDISELKEIIICTDNLRKGGTKPEHKRSTPGSSDSSVERKTYHDSKHEPNDEPHNPLQQLMPKFDTKSSYNNQTKFSRDQMPRNNSIQDKYLPNYSRPTQKSAHASRHNKLSLAGEMNKKLGLLKKKGNFFGSLISYQSGQGHNNAWSERNDPNQGPNGCKTTKNKQVDAFGWMSSDQRGTPLSSHQKTLSIQENCNIERTIKQKLNKSHNRLTKNLGFVYNKMALEEIQKQKKQFAEVTLKKSFKAGVNVQHTQVQLIKQQQQQERDLQDMDTRNFIKYLNRDVKSHLDKQPVVNVRGSYNLDAYKTPQMSPELKGPKQFKITKRVTNLSNTQASLIKTSALDHTKPLSQTQFMSPQSSTGQNFFEQGTTQVDEGESRTQLLKQQRSLNKYRFRQTLSLSKYKDHINSAQRRDRFFVNKKGISNYDYVLGNETTQSPKNGVKSGLTNFIYTEDHASPNDQMEDDSSLEDKMQHHEDKRRDMMDDKHNLALGANMRDVRSATANQQSWYRTQRHSGQQSYNFQTGQPSCKSNLQIRTDKRPSIVSMEDGGPDIELKVYNAQNAKDGRKSNIEAKQMHVKHMYDKSSHSVKSDKQMAIYQQLFEMRDANMVMPTPQKQKLDNLSIKISDMNVQELNDVISDFDDLKQKTLQDQKRDELQETFNLTSPNIVDQSKLEEPKPSPHLQRKRIKPKAAKHGRTMKSGESFKLDSRKMDPRKPQQHASQMPSMLTQKWEDNSTLSHYFGELDDLNPAMKQQNAKNELMQDFICNLPGTVKVPPLLSNEKLAYGTDEIGKDLKLLIQGCERLVIAADEYPELEINQSQEIELQPQTALFYRINILDLPSPLKFEIKYHDIECRLSGLEVLLSTKEKNPSYTNHEVAFNSEETYYLPANKLGITSFASQMEEAALQAANKGSVPLPQKAQEQTNVFKDRHMYICLNSYSGCSITLLVRTIASRQDANKLALVKFKEKRQKFAEEATEQLMKEDDPYVVEMRAEDEALQDRLRRFREYVSDVTFEKLYYPDKENELLKFKEKNKQNRLALARKGAIDTANFKMKIFLLVRSLYLKEYKGKHLDDFYDWLRQTTYATNIAKRVLCRQIYQNIFKRFETHKAYTERQWALKFIVIRIKQNMRNRQNLCSKDIKVRMQQFLRQELNLLANCMIDGCEKNSKKMFKRFLVDWGRKDDLKNRIKRTAQLVWVVCRKYRKAKCVNEERENAIREFWWEKAKFAVVGVLKGRNATERQQKIGTAINSIDEVTHHFMARCYYRRQKISAHHKFIQWVIAERDWKDEQEPKPEVSAIQRKIYDAYQIQVPIFQRYLDDIDAFLKDGVGKIKFTGALKKQATTAMTTSPKAANKASPTARKKKEALKMPIDTFIKKAMRPPMPCFSILQGKDNPTCIKKLVVRAGLIMMQTKDDALDKEMDKFAAIEDKYKLELDQCMMGHHAITPSNRFDRGFLKKLMQRSLTISLETIFPGAQTS